MLSRYYYDVIVLLFFSVFNKISPPITNFVMERKIIIIIQWLEILFALQFAKTLRLSGTLVDIVP